MLQCGINDHQYLLPRISYVSFLVLLVTKINPINMELEINDGPYEMKAKSFL